MGDSEFLNGDKLLHLLSHTELQERCMALRDENIRLMESLCAVRCMIVDAQKAAASSRFHALRWAANTAQYHCVHAHGLAYPSAIGADIADRITQEMAREPKTK